MDTYIEEHTDCFALPEERLRLLCESLHTLSQFDHPLKGRALLVADELLSRLTREIFPTPEENPPHA